MTRSTDSFAHFAERWATEARALGGLFVSLPHHRADVSACILAVQSTLPPDAGATLFP
jgi:hypothetical protein